MPQKKYTIVAVGRAYTDIVASVSDEFLQMHQIPVNGQRECSVAEIKIIQESLPSRELIAGGSSANTSTVISALGGSAGFFGKVFHDATGESFLKDLAERKIDLCCQSDGQKPEMSAICLVLLTHQERSFAYNPGCADNFSLADFNQFNFLTTNFFLVEAHLLTSAIASPSIIDTISLAQNKTSIVINLQGISQWDNFAEVLQCISSKANIIIGNQQEQQAYAQTTNQLQLSPQSEQLIITTKGAAGADISRLGKQLCSIPAVSPKKFANSSGAGDAFIAGFLFAQSKGRGILESMHCAVKTASTILEEVGARPTRSLEHIAAVFNHHVLFKQQQKKPTSPNIFVDEFPDDLLSSAFCQGTNAAKMLKRK